MASIREHITSLVTGKSLYGADPKQDELDATDWTLELQGADRWLEKWHTQGKKTVDAYLGNWALADRQSRLNLFYSNIVTLRALLFSKLPKIASERRFADPDDDAARVASEMMTRVLESEMYDPEDTFSSATKEALQDKLIPGLGCVRIKYGMTEGPDETQEQVAGEDGEMAYPQKKTDEWCDFVYTHWKDIRWSPCRTRAELRWKAYRSYLSKEEATERFGEEVAGQLSYASKGPDLQGSSDSTSKAWASTAVQAKQAEVWEIWDKDTKKVNWYCKGYEKLLEVEDDPLGLPEFFPDEFMLANTVSDRLVPKPDYAMAEDLYKEIDLVQTRISFLTEAAKCVGVYDQSAKEVARIFTEGLENTLIPVTNWAMFADKGGLKGVLDWVPLEPVAKAIEILQVQLEARIKLLFEVTGMSDIMRGNSNANETLGAQKIKSQFASTRIQAMQDDFAIFTESLFNKKACIVRKFYSDDQILKLSNILNTPDAALAPEALALIRKPEFYFRVVIRASSMAQQDLEKLKADRAEYMQAVAQYMGQTLPFVQMLPESLPFTLELLKFGLASFPSADEIEGVLDRFVSQVEQKLKAAAEAPPKPDPAVAQAQADMQMEQQKMQGEAQLKQQEVQADLQIAQQEAQLAMQEMQAKFQLEVQKMQQEMQQDREKHELEMEALRAKIQGQRESAQIQAESAQVQASIAADSAQTQGDIKAEQQETQGDLKLEQTKAQAKARPANSNGD